eukprot:393844-Pyramimonas_sp.AAC.1
MNLIHLSPVPERIPDNGIADSKGDRPLTSHVRPHCARHPTQVARGVPSRQSGRSRRNSGAWRWRAGGGGGMCGWHCWSTGRTPPGGRLREQPFLRRWIEGECAVFAGADSISRKGHVNAPNFPRILQGGGPILIDYYFDRT